MGFVNARGAVPVVRLHDIPNHVREVTLHGVRHGAAMALAAAQVHSGHDLHAMEVGFPIGDGPKGHEYLIEDFTAAAEAIMDITSAQDVVNKVFD